MIIVNPKPQLQDDRMNGDLLCQVAPTSREQSEGGRIAISFNYRGRWDVTGSALSVALAGHI